TDVVGLRGSDGTVRKSKTDFTINGLRRRCAPKHRNSRRETAGWDRVDHQEVFVLCWKAGPSPNVGSAKGSGREVLADGHKPTQLPALLISRLCLTGECLPAREVLAHGHHPGAIPGSRTNLLTGCASARGESPKLNSGCAPAPPGGTEAACHFLLGSWQTSNALALQA